MTLGFSPITLVTSHNFPSIPTDSEQLDIDFEELEKQLAENPDLTILDFVDVFELF